MLDMLTVVRAQFAQSRSDVRSLGRLCKVAQTQQDRAIVLGLLAVEIAYQKRNKAVCDRLLGMAKTCAEDDYKTVVRLKGQEWVVLNLLAENPVTIEAVRKDKEEFWNNR